jgi:hypothetical protein
VGKTKKDTKKQLISKVLEQKATKMIKDADASDKLKELGIKNNFKLKL